MNNFSAEESIKSGWQTFMARPWFFVGIGAIILVFSSISSSISSSTQDGNMNAILALIVFLCSLAVSTLFDMGVTSVSLKASQSANAPRFEDLWHPKSFWIYLGAALLTGIVVMLGIVLLIIPGIIFALMLLFVKFIIIERGLGPIEAMKESRRITNGHKWKLLVLLILIILMNIAGLLALFVGLLVSIPISLLAMAHAYRSLSRMSTPVQSA